MWKISYYWDNLDKKRVCLHISNSESNGFSSCGLEVEVSQLPWLVRILTDSHQLLLSDVGAVAATDIYWDFGPKLTERKDTSQARKNTVRYDRSVGGGHSIYRTINGFSLVQLHFNISTVWNLPWGWMVWVHERVRSSAAPMVFGGETCQKPSAFPSEFPGTMAGTPAISFLATCPWLAELGSSTSSTRLTRSTTCPRNVKKKLHPGGIIDGSPEDHPL